MGFSAALYKGMTKGAQGAEMHLPTYPGLNPGSGLNLPRGLLCVIHIMHLMG